jgi:fumarate hydratase class II
VRALCLIKAAAARANVDLELLPQDKADAISKAALTVAEGGYDEQFQLMFSRPEVARRPT